MKAVAQMLAAVIIIFFLPAMLLSIDAFRLQDRTDVFTVSSGATSANVTLTQDLYNDATVHVTSVTSNVTTDAAVASAYTAATNVLNITGLDSGASHYLTVVYSIDRLSEYFAAHQAALAVPGLILLGILCIVAGAGVWAFKHVKGES